jgi:hypothetical protein
VARKDRQKKRTGRDRISQSQLQAYRARQEAVASREEVEQRRLDEQRREREREARAAARAEEQYADVLGTARDESDEAPKLSPEYIAGEYASVRQELNRIAIWGGLSFVLLAIIAVYMN